MPVSFSHTVRKIVKVHHSEPSNPLIPPHTVDYQSSARLPGLFQTSLVFAAAPPTSYDPAFFAPFFPRHNFKFAGKASRLLLLLLPDEAPDRLTSLGRNHTNVEPNVVWRASRTQDVPIECGSHSLRDAADRGRRRERLGEAPLREDFHRPVSDAGCDGEIMGRFLQRKEKQSSAR